MKIELSGAPRHSGARTAAAGLAAVASLLAASSCCLPVLPFLMAAGFAASSAILVAAKPYLWALSIFSIAYGFYQSWRLKKCRRRPSLIASFLLWISTALVAMSIFFPQVIANLAANLPAR